ncbi:hypothetical protein EVAR_71270_1 [Eumeta japonica]|uniref:Uncharacterized protein n=1 Tax=Eumeta variegata TaxID=151549 RepID=A0A4C2ABH9_EUMVA|nr:hypothetical protein EVAR_71270_1 [Eumeta japonica]
MNSSGGPTSYPSEKLNKTDEYLVHTINNPIATGGGIVGGSSASTIIKPPAIAALIAKKETPRDATKQKLSQRQQAQHLLKTLLLLSLLRP